MTKYHSRAEINQSCARFDADDKRSADAKVCDAASARDFAATSLWTEETRQMPVQTASDMGVLALTIVRHVLEPIKAQARANPKAAQDALWAFFKDLPVPDARDLSRTVTDLKSLTGAFRTVLQARPQTKGLKLNAQYFGAAVTAFQSGYDGHWITREAALRLRLVRFYEKAGSDFTQCLHRAMAVLSRNGTAYAAWSRGLPLLICDLNRTFERYAAQELFRLTQGEAVVVTTPMTAQTQALVARYASGLPVVTDAAGLFATLVGDYAHVMLLERRVGGWTLTFPAGGAHERDLKNRKYPAFARALARCASLPPALCADQASKTVSKPTEGKRQTQAEAS